MKFLTTKFRKNMKKRSFSARVCELGPIVAAAFVVGVMRPWPHHLLRCKNFFASAHIPDSESLRTSLVRLVT
jgi:hypothetical protein